MNVDPMADKFPSLSSYNYVFNNPIQVIDPDGMCPTCTEEEFNNLAHGQTIIKEGVEWRKIGTIFESSSWRNVTEFQKIVQEGEQEYLQQQEQARFAACVMANAATADMCVSSAAPSQEQMEQASAYGLIKWAKSQSTTNEVPGGFHSTDGFAQAICDQSGACDGTPGLIDVTDLTIGFLGVARGVVKATLTAWAMRRATATVVDDVLEVNPWSINFSQASINGGEEIAKSMNLRGWKGKPIDVVNIDGQLITIDNTRVYAASKAHLMVKVRIHQQNDLLPIEQTIPDPLTGYKRFGDSKTWGEAVLFRIGNQSKMYQRANPRGSYGIRNKN